MALLGADTELKGTLGWKGERGYSAYEIAVMNGYVGTEKDWLATLGTSSHFDRKSEIHTATVGQAEFPIPEYYTSSSFIDVYVDGEHLDSTEYTMTDGKIILTNAITVDGTKIEIITITMSTNNLPIVENIDENSTNNEVLGAKSLYNILPINVRDYGAKGDGVTDDTEAIQNAINNAPEGSTVIFDKGIYLHDTVIVEKNNIIINGNNTTHKLSKNDSACFRLFDSKNVVIENFIIEGNSNNDTKQHGISSISGHSYDNICVRNNTITDVAVGITVASDISGHLNKVDIHNNYLKNIKGTVAGTGYGIHVSNGNDEWSNCSIYNNSIDLCERHSIYVARGKGYTVKNNYISNHRLNVKDNNVRPALNISRSSYVNVVNNMFEHCYDCNICIQAEEKPEEIYPLGAYPATNINITGNMFSNGNNLSAIYIGYLDPTQGLPKEIVISDNSFKDVQALNIRYGYNILFANNMCTYTENLVVCDSTSDNSDYYMISNNHFVVKREDGLGAAIRLQPNVCTGNTNMSFFNNTTNNRKMFNSASVVSNNNISLIGEETGLIKDATFAYKQISINGQKY